MPSDARAVEALAGALDDQDENVRRYAASSLGALGDARSVEPLIGALRDEDSGVRCIAARALGQLGDARAVEPLIGALGDQDQIVRLKATQALGVLSDASAVEPLIRALGDEDGRVREDGAEALGEYVRGIMATKAAATASARAAHAFDRRPNLPAVGRYDHVHTVCWRADEPLRYLEVAGGAEATDLHAGFAEELMARGVVVRCWKPPFNENLSSFDEWDWELFDSQGSKIGETRCMEDVRR